MSEGSDAARPDVLHRRLTLPLLVLYGVGVTVGAGIYVLIGAMAGHAGIYAPFAFLLAGVVMSFTAASYAELSGHFPVSAGEAAYVRAAFDVRAITIAVGSLTIFIGVISAAAVSVGSAGYIRQFVDLPQVWIVLLVIAVIAAVSAWGILQSVLFASLFTVIEVGGLIVIIAAGSVSDIAWTTELPRLLVPPLDADVWTGIALASLLGFFAFIGFEDLANVAEEAQDATRTVPLAIVITLVISVALYLSVAAVAVLAVPIDELSASPAPLSLVFHRVTTLSPASMSAIAIVATLNTVLVQMTMASRVIFGMARQGDLPAWMAKVNPATGTPLPATLLVAGSVALFAVALPITQLAEWTSLATLFVFAWVNVALLFLRRRQPAPGQRLVVPAWVPAAGAVTCVLMLMFAFL